MKLLIAIPSRYNAERLPGKPLVDLAGEPMIHHVWRRAMEAADRMPPHIQTTVVVATDHLAIAESVRSIGGKAVITKEEHLSGTSRCREALDLMDSEGFGPFDLIINLQGDEPLANPDHMVTLAQSSASLASLYTPSTNPEEWNNPAHCFVVVNAAGHAQYFSRFSLPYQRTEHEAPKYRHLGLYAYAPSALRAVVNLPQAPNEKAESLEQLRWLHHGFTLEMCCVENAFGGVDTPEDAAHFDVLLRKRRP